MLPLGTVAPNLTWLCTPSSNPPTHQYGEVELIKKQADYAFVHFVRREDAKRAIEDPPKEIDGQSVRSMILQTKSQQVSHK